MQTKLIVFLVGLVALQGCGLSEYRYKQAKRSVEETNVAIRHANTRLKDLETRLTDLEAKASTLEGLEKESFNWRIGAFVAIAVAGIVIVILFQTHLKVPVNARK